jgi:hypothetical protein
MTGSSGSRQAIPYNSSASVVAAVWLFADIYLLNCLKVLRPAMMISIIQGSIFVIIASTYAPTFPNMDAGMNFVRRMLITYLTGFGIATGVNLIVIPLTSRLTTAKQYAGLLGLMKLALVTQGSFMETVGNAHQRTTDNKGAETDTSDVKKKAQELKTNLLKVSELFSKTKIELSFAKKEFGIGKLGPDEYGDIFTRLADIVLPIMGMSTFLDIMSTLQDRKIRRNKLVDGHELLEAIRMLESSEWMEAIAVSREAYHNAKGVFIMGLTHVGLVLELTPKPKAPKGDVEKDAAATPKPGDPTFSAFLAKAVDDYHQHRMTAIQKWCEKKGIDLPPTFFNSPHAEYRWKDSKSMSDSVRQTQNQQQLYLILYMEYLMHSIGKAILKASQYADSKVADGTLSKTRFINPGPRRIQKLFADLFVNKDSDNIMRDGESTGTSIWLGDGLNVRKDPEHLPPATAWQKGTNWIRAIPQALASEASTFGFRAAVATMSLGVLAYIEQTHRFFQDQRVVWALIMTAISMDSSTGRGLFGFFGRILGTAVACASSIAIWYIGYKTPGAIIPIFFLYICCCFFLLLKHPQHAIVMVISIVTAILIIGYELQEQKIGRAAVESSGQPYYVVYILAPYRLATVVAGIAVAFIWSYFPYPVTTHGTLRRDLGETLYLLANYYSCVHTTVHQRLKNGADASLEQERQLINAGLGGPKPPKRNKKTPVPPMIKLAKARMKCFSKLIVLISKLREHSSFSKWEPTFGGKFPRETYDELIDSLQHMFNYISLIAYSSAAFVTGEDVDPDGDGNESAWLRDFRTFTSELNLTSHQLTSTLILVSSSVQDSRPLPPYLSTPTPFELAEKMAAVDPGILSIQHIKEPCYAAFAVLEVASSLIVEEVRVSTAKVVELVGEVDFSFHVVSTREGMGSVSTLVEEGNGREKGKQA